MKELNKIDPTILLDIRYAREDNFVGRPVYRSAQAFLQTAAADDLVKAHRNLASKGFGLVIFDGYRPWSVTKLFWDVVPLEQRIYVADPAEGSKHNRGCAVDLTLYSLETGLMADMPSDFDEFNEKAHPEYDGATEIQKKNRQILRGAMEMCNYTVNPKEWWHFDHVTWPEHEILDISFEELSRNSPENLVASQEA
ncbi:MAG: M15 family metallopeptidase [Pyrinomonadaceae bacterium]